MKFNECTWEPCGLAGSPAGNSHETGRLCACRSQHAEGLRRGFRCSVRSQEAETRQSTDGHTSAAQTDFALVLLDSPLTNLFAWLLMQVWGILEVELALYFLRTAPGSLYPKRGSIWKINLKIFVRWKFITTRPMDKATQAREVCCLWDRGWVLFYSVLKHLWMLVLTLAHPGETWKAFRKRRTKLHWKVTVNKEVLSHLWCWQGLTKTLSSLLLETGGHELLLGLSTTSGTCSSKRINSLGLALSPVCEAFSLAKRHQLTA